MEKFAEKIEVFVILIAGIITAIISLFQDVELNVLMIRFIIVVIISYLCALMFRIFIGKEILD